MSKYGVKCDYGRVAPRPPALPAGRLYGALCGVNAVLFYKVNPIGGSHNFDNEAFARCEKHSIYSYAHEISEEEFIVTMVMCE